MAEQNLDEILKLTEEIRLLFPDKTIWLYSGYCFEDCLIKEKMCEENIYRVLRYEIIKNIDVMVDGRYIDSQKDITLKYRGSSNQRLIDVKQSLYKGEVILYDN